MSINADIEQRIKDAIPDADVEVRSGSPGHFEISVTSTAFDGKSPVAKQRLVLKAISPLMEGADAPVHAVDKLTTLVPGA
jgi:stress-induced morphogen